MKKIKVILVCIMFTILIGCELNNTPTSKVEQTLMDYQMAKPDKITTGVELLTNADNLTENEQDEYEKIVTKQYKSLSYNVKDETTDGNRAIIKVEIEVLDYKKELDNIEMQTNANYQQERINKLTSAKDKITYTIEFSVVKNAKDEWEVEPLTKAEEQKILGIY